MFAGKTTRILELVADYESQQQRVALVTSAMDKRYGVKRCATHSGISRPAFAVANLMSLMSACTESNWQLDNFDVIAIDESQFFPDLFEFCMHAVEDHGKAVIVAGLSGDFRRQQFGDILRLVPLADDVRMLRARCAFCEADAPFSLRLVASAEQALVGGKDEYQPVCRTHYRRLSAVHDNFE